MNKIKEIYDFIDTIAPFNTALSFDNVGLLVGNGNMEVSKVLLALDITDEVCAEAVSLGAQLIISHHPIIFKPLKSIDFDSVLVKLTENKISAICAHTNLDIAEKGVNYQLALKLGLTNLNVLTYEEEKPMGLIGHLSEEMTLIQFASFVKEGFNCNGIRYTATNNKKIQKVAVCSGAGGSFIEEAYKNSADAFVTGEIKHSDILKANHLDVAVVDVGHYNSENVIIDPLKDMLSNTFPEIQFFASNKHMDKINYL